MRYTTLLTGLLLGMALAFATPALADHERRSGYHQPSHHHYHGHHHKGGRHYRAPHYARHYRHHHRPSRIIEKHVIIHEQPRYLPPRHGDHHYYHRSSSVPLVTVGGYPVVTIRVD
ncbi:hypothetical protein [Litchfieldella rifensis]|uniref:Uncharacterized protein n=1 Tax=Litchfieldella rifensis TaxID=762643 RepID=A0ABV7LMQ6_9GAMM